MKSVVGALKLELSQYEEVARFARFGTEVNEATKRQIERGQRLEALLGQGPNRPIRMDDQVILFYALTKGFMDEVKPEAVAQYAHDLLVYVHNHAGLPADQIRIHRRLTEEIDDELVRELEAFNEIWKKKVKRSS